MKLRFQADADLRLAILTAVLRREPAIDFQSAEGAALGGLGDAEVLLKAAREGRLLVTHDARTMPRHFAEFVITRPSPGLIVIPQTLPTHAAVEDLLLIWSTSETSEWINRICRLPL